LRCNIRQIALLARPIGITGKGERFGGRSAAQKKKLKATKQIQKLNIFVSYSHADRAIAKDIFYALKDAGYSPWLDSEQLLPGQYWDLEIKKAIRTTDLVLLLLSDNWINKEGYMQKEIRVALEAAQTRTEGSVFIMPVRLSQIEPPSNLEKYQWVDYFVEDGKEKLLKAISSIADKRGK
jgi:hypothetical protein